MFNVLGSPRTEHVMRGWDEACCLHVDRSDRVLRVRTPSTVADTPESLACADPWLQSASLQQSPKRRARCVPLRPPFSARTPLALRCRLDGYLLMLARRSGWLLGQARNFTPQPSLLRGPRDDCT